MMGEVYQYVIERVDDGDKEKKKKRRSNRRSKQNASSSSSVSCCSINGINWEASACLKNCRIDDDVAGLLNDPSLKKHTFDTLSPTGDALISALNVSSSSLPAMHMIEYEDTLESQMSRSQHLSSNCVVISKSHSQPEQGVLDSKFSKTQHAFSNDNGSVMSKLCPGPCTRTGLSPSHQVVGNTPRKYFPPHWSMEAVNKAVQKGDVFKAVFRINAHNKLEAYCKIDGVPTDILINGISLQNRAVEGDIVAVKVDPVTLWTRMRGSIEVPYKSSTMKDGNSVTEDSEIELHNCKGKCKRDGESECSYGCSQFPLKEASNESCTFFDKGIHLDEPLTSADQVDGYCLSNALVNMCHMICSLPSKRPTGRVVAIIERSPRRDTVVGFLNVKQFVTCREDQKELKKTNSFSFSDYKFIQLTPTDPRLPKMMVSVRYLPDIIKKRLEKGDATIERELVGGRIVDWGEESYNPPARILLILGRGGEIQSHINAILFENDIPSREFSPNLLPWIPQGPWEVPLSEYKERTDMRNLCIFTIDPATATDLDDALSVERLADNIYRVGVHIADVSYFVSPDTALDREAQKRSTSVYLVDHKVSILPSLLSEDIGSLNPGKNRLAFSMFFDIDHTGVVIDRWIGRTVIRSCCKLSYKDAQCIVDGLFDGQSSKTWKNVYPQLHGQIQWKHVVRSVEILNDISKCLRKNRFSNGALRLETPKVVFLRDERGIPYDSMLCERNDSNFLVEEFMLLANTTAAEVISRAFPASALLRRHPEPNIRRLRDFEAFCLKHSLELDVSSSGQFNLSLERLKLKLKNDSVLFDILNSYASRPMQAATYFCSGQFKDSVKDWYHYALAVPLYTHFTSPLRRYPDIIVHRFLASIVEAENALKRQSTLKNVNRSEEIAGKCFTGLVFDKSAAESLEMGKALSSAALRHRVPGTEPLAGIAVHCNERKLASRHAKDASDKLYMWAMLKKNEFLITNARVLGLGPRFMSIYVHKLAIERRIYYDEIEGLTVEWHDLTSSLVLSLCANRRSIKRGSPSKWRALEEVALVVSPCDLECENGMIEGSFSMFGSTQVEYTDVKSINFKTEIDPPVFPLTIHLLSTIPVVLHAVGGDDGPTDISARLLTSSYLR